MKLLELKASRYRSLRDEALNFEDLNIFIGANASGKSTILDALRFLHEGLRAGDFREAVRDRGGLRFLSWKGEEASQVSLTVRLEDEEQQVRYTWSIGLIVESRRFSVNEEAFMLRQDGPEVQLLSVSRGTGWWLSGKETKVQIDQRPTMCALATAASDVAFPARQVSDFISEWGFFDPDLFSLRRRWRGDELERLDTDGRNLAERLYRIKESSPEIFEQIASAINSVLGTPEKLEAVEVDGEYHLHFYEFGLNSPVSQRSASSGTLRILTLMTALFEDPGRSLLAIEEPENNIHPSALGDFVQYLIDASRRMQLLITTHSPNLLNFLDDPTSICVVRRDDVEGTRVTREINPQGVADALEVSGFQLGEFHETKGFGR